MSCRVSSRSVSSCRRFDSCLGPASRGGVSSSAGRADGFGRASHPLPRYRLPPSAGAVVRPYFAFGMPRLQVRVLPMAALAAAVAQTGRAGYQEAGRLLPHRWFNMERCRSRAILRTVVAGVVGSSPTLCRAAQVAQVDRARLGGPAFVALSSFLGSGRRRCRVAALLRSEQSKAAQLLPCTAQFR